MKTRGREAIPGPQHGVRRACERRAAALVAPKFACLRAVRWTPPRDARAIRDDCARMLLEGAAVLVLLVLLARWKSPEIYDIVILHMTERWYSEVLGRLEPGARVLDVGIGTGGALCRPANAALVATNRLKIVGIDYEERYIAKAKAASASAGLSEAVKVHCASVYDPSLPEMVGKDFDCACARLPAPSPAAAPRLALTPAR